MDSRLDKLIKRGVKVSDSPIEGFKELKGATTAPRGYKWYSNGKSLFGSDREIMLVKDQPKGDENKWQEHLEKTQRIIEGNWKAYAEQNV